MNSKWHYIDQGRGPNLVLLHGLGASGFSWRHNLARIIREKSLKKERASAKIL